MIYSFLDYLIKESTTDVENIPDFYAFCDSLMMYIDVNDEESKEELSESFKYLANNNFLSKKTVWKLVKVQESKIKEINGLSSCSTSMLKGNILESMKRTVSDYSNNNEDFWYIEYKSVLGLDINSFYKEHFKGKKKYFTKKYDKQYQTIDALYDIFEGLKEQKEFIAYGKYKPTKRIKVG
jgi:hypothetical protein